MQEQIEKDRKLSNKKLRELICKKPRKERMAGGGEIMYSMLEKYNKIGLWSHKRFVVLIWGQKIGYLSELPEDIFLPFTQLSDLPPFKSDVSLQEIKEVLIQSQKKLEIRFVTPVKGEDKWVFKCDSAKCADTWKTCIEEAKSAAPPSPEVETSLSAKLVSPSSVKLETSLGKKSDPPTNGVNRRPALNVVIPSQGSDVALNPEIVVNPEEPITPTLGSKLQSLVSPVEKLVEQSKSWREEEQSNSEHIYPILYHPTTSNVSSSEGRSSKKNSLSNIELLQPKETSISRVSDKSEIEKLSLSRFNHDLHRQLEIQLHNQKDWNFEFETHPQQQAEILHQFSEYTKQVAQLVVDDLSLAHQYRRTTGFLRSEQPHRFCYSLNSGKIEVQVLLCEEIALNGKLCEQHSTKRIAEDGKNLERIRNGRATSKIETSTNSERVIRAAMSKEVGRMWKNQNYILQKSKNRGKIRVPLSAIIWYRGFNIYLRAAIPSTKSYQIDSLVSELQFLETETLISSEIFKQQGNAKIVAVDPKSWSKSLRNQENALRIGTKSPYYFYLLEVESYLPMDPNPWPHHPAGSRCVRRELFKDQVWMHPYEGFQLKFGEWGEFGEESQKAKILGLSIHNKLMVVRDKLESAEEIVTNSKEFSQLLHDYGINLRYLGELFCLLSSPWLKTFVRVEMLTRSAKWIFRFQLQKLALNLHSDSPASVSKMESKFICEFLNNFFFSNPTLWNALHSQVSYSFGLQLPNLHSSSSLIDLPFRYTFTSLLYHCGLKFATDQFGQPILPLPGSQFSEKCVGSFEIQTKVYDLEFTELYQRIDHLLGENSAESCSEVLSLVTRGESSRVEEHFFLNGWGDRILNYLWNWYPPQTHPQFYYGLYPFDEMRFLCLQPSIHIYRSIILQIKWELKHQHLSQAQSLLQAINSHLQTWLFHPHPLLTQIYEIFALWFAKSRLSEEQTLIYAKMALTNHSSLLLPNHPKLADTFYLLATLHLDLDNKSEAQTALQHAKELLELNNLTNLPAYATICLKIAQISLAFGFLAKTVENAKKSEEIFQKEQRFQHLEMETLELQARAYELMDNQSEWLQFANAKLISRLKAQSHHPESLQKILRLLLVAYFQPLLFTPEGKRFRELWEQLPHLTQPRNQSYFFLKKEIERQSFPGEFLKIVLNPEQILQEIQETNFLPEWKKSGGISALKKSRQITNISISRLTEKSLSQPKSNTIDFLNQLQALSLFLGRDFFEGLLSLGY